MWRWVPGPMWAQRADGCSPEDPKYIAWHFVPALTKLLSAREESGSIGGNSLFSCTSLFSLLCNCFPCLLRMIYGFIKSADVHYIFLPPSAVYMFPHISRHSFSFSYISDNSFPFGSLLRYIVIISFLSLLHMYLVASKRVFHFFFQYQLNKFYNINKDLVSYWQEDFRIYCTILSKWLSLPSGSPVARGYMRGESWTRVGGLTPSTGHRQDRVPSQLSSRLGRWKPGEIPPSREEERAKTGPQRKTPLFQLGPWDSPLSHYLFLILRPPANFNWLLVKAIKDSFFSSIFQGVVYQGERRPRACQASIIWLKILTNFRLW